MISNAKQNISNAVQDYYNQMPDMWNVVTSGVKLLSQVNPELAPDWVKGAIAVMNVQHIVVIPKTIQSYFNQLKDITVSFAQPQKTINKIEKIFYSFATVGYASMLTGVTTLGIRAMVNPGTRIYDIATKVINYTLPWVKFVSRMKMIFIVRNLWMDYKLSSQLKEKLNHKEASACSQERIKDAVKVLKDCDSVVLKKINGAKGDLTQRIDAIYKRMVSSNLDESKAGYEEAKDMITDVQKRTTIHAKSEAWNLTAHSFALAGIFASGPVVPVALSLLASLAWIKQYYFLKANS